MDSFSTAFSRELAKRIEEAAERERAALETGAAVDNHAEYKQKVGRLYAYRQVLTEFMPEVESDLNNPKKGER